ncbi:MAG: tetratricopeptide repeat protein [Gemmatimonadales bacterium]
MMHLAVSEDDIVKAESLVVRVGKDYADSAMFAVAKGDSALVTRLLGEARDSAGNGLVFNAAWQIGEWLEQPAAAERFARIAAARPERPAQANTVLAANLVSQGRWTAGDSAFRRAMGAATDGVPRLKRGIAAALPFLEVPRPELEAISADLSAWDPAADQSSGLLVGPVPGMLPAARLYALGLLAVRLGQPEAAARAAAQLEALPATDPIAGPARSLAAAVRADIALAARHPADAVAALAGVRGAVPLSLSGVSPFSEDYARFLRGEALLALGKDDEAQRWLENGFGGTPDVMTFRAPVLFRLGDIYERKGERQKAIDAYARFVRLWSACDAPLRPAVDDARARLARLTAEPRS